MKEAIAWVILLVVFSIAFVRTSRFRAGTDRVYLSQYRDPTRAAMVRNSPLLMPFVSTVALIALVLGGFAYVEGWPGSRPTAADVGIAFAITASLLALAGLGPVVLYRRPKWLIPRWLAADDQEAGFVPPDPTWFDRFCVAGGLVSIGTAVLLTLYGVTTITGR